MRVFLDANVLFSASNSTSNIARLIQLLFERDTAVSSDFAIEEARRNIELKRPAWAEDFQRLTAQIEIVPSVQFALPVELAEKTSRSCAPPFKPLVQPSSPATNATSDTSMAEPLTAFESSPCSNSPIS